MIGVVLAGGASRRFGGRAKGLAPFRGRAMALHAADMLGRFCSRVVIEAPAGAGYEALGLPLIEAAPAHAGKGPLAGLAAGLAAAEGRAAFAACDMPLLTPAIYAALARAGAPGAYACTQVGVEPLVCVLDARVLPALLSALEAEAVPRILAVFEAAGAHAVRFDDPAPFANVNTPADLARLAAP